MSQTESSARQLTSTTGQAGGNQIWQYFPGIEDAGAFYITWLSLQFNKIPDAISSVLLLKNPQDGVFAPVAVWPDPNIDLSRLQAAAEAAIEQKQGLVFRSEETADSPSSVQLSCPLEVNNRVDGVVVIEVADRPEAELDSLLNQVQWDLGWLSSRIWQEQSAMNQLMTARSALALDILAVAEEHTLVEPACMAVANEIAVKLDCDRVAIGLVRKRAKSGARVLLRAMSHSAWYRKKTSLVEELENAMEEALDQNTTVVFPFQPYAAKTIAVAHKEYAENWKVRHLVSFVLTDKSVPVGVMTFERRSDQAFSEDTVKSGESIAALIGPVLDLKRRERRWFAGRIADGIRGFLHKLFGRRHPALKLLVTLIILCVIGLFYYTTTFRISGDAVLEGASQRVSVVPFDGFIDEAKVRAGDIVKQGQLLATLDDKDLQIEVYRWESEKAKLIQQQRQALVGKERTEIALLEAQIRQADAQLSLSRQKLARTLIKSPVDGLVISGDLSQRLGSPVQKGETLFEIAPLKNYRVVLKIDERDIRYIEVGDKGTLLLSGMAGKSIPLTVGNVTAVSEADDGLNIFRVEATLAEGMEAIRPGMEGVGKVDIDERSIGWIWTRTFMNWLRVFIWQWTP